MEKSFRVQFVKYTEVYGNHVVHLSGGEGGRGGGQTLLPPVEIPRDLAFFCAAC